MAMTITYEFEGALYVNLTNACSNDCEFCLRNNHDGVNGEDILWLDREPTLDEIIADFSKRNLAKYSWVVFCGYGEPMMRYQTLMYAAKWLKSMIFRWMISLPPCTTRWSPMTGVITCT